MFRILLTGGGTGGHIYPLVAVSAELRAAAHAKNIELDSRYLGAPGAFKNVLEENQIPVKKILGSKWRRYFDLQNFLDIPKFFISFFQAVWKVFWIMPDALFSKGGPGSFSVVLACRFYRIPVFLHESDAVPSLASRLAARYSKWIGLAFEEAREFLPKNKAEIAVVGNPIRQSLLGRKDSQQTLKKALGFNAGEPLLLVLGSSQGAQRINDFILDALPLLIRETQILHQTGAGNFAGVRREADVLLKQSSAVERARYYPVPYLDKNYADALSAADVVASRASSSSIFEIAALGKPSILIPLPDAAQDHQRVNAYAYAKNGAAIVIETDNLKPNIFTTQLKQLLATPGKLQEMSAAARQFAKPEAARLIAETLLEMK